MSGTAGKIHFAFEIAQDVGMVQQARKAISVREFFQIAITVCTAHHGGNKLSGLQRLGQKVIRS